MRASRLLSLLLLLQTRGRMTAQELADELEVSVRTVYRDVESLSAAGVPVYADRGPAGGYQLVAGYRTRLTGLTSEEADALFFAGMPGQAAELGLGAVLAAAQLKLLAALPAELRTRAGAIRDRFHLDAPGWFQENETAEHLAGVAGAVWDQRVISVRYRRWDNSEVDRRVEPLGLVLKNGTWYLIAGISRPRTFRVSRVLGLEVLDERFDRPAGFDLAAHWETASKDLRELFYRNEAVVRLSPTARRKAYLMGPVEARAVARNAGPPDEDGWTRVVLPIETHQHALGVILRLGSGAEVLEPPELRALVTATVAELREIYDG